MVDRLAPLWDSVDFAWISGFLYLRAVRSLAETARTHPAAEVPFARSPARMMPEEKFAFEERWAAAEFADDYFCWREERYREEYESERFEAQYR